MPAVVFHRFHDGSPRWPAVPESMHVEDFERWIIAHRPRIRRAEDILLTFDDGLLCQTLILPILKKHELTGIFFVNTAPLIDVPLPDPLDFEYWNTRPQLWRYWRDRFPRTYERVMERLRPGGDAQELCQQHWLGSTHLTQLFLAGHRIGNHTHTHPHQMDHLPAWRQRMEWMTAHTLLLPFQPRDATAPDGRLSEVSRKILEAYGYQIWCQRVTFDMI